MTNQTPWMVWVLVGSIPQLAIGGSPREGVIYGDDDRQDLYQVQNSRDARLAASTVALVEARNLVRAGENFRIAAETFGREFGLCPTERFFDQPSAAFCSGALVAPDLVFTAGHCVRTAADCAATKFVFGYAVEKEGAYPATASPSDVFGCKEIVARKQEGAGSNFAVIRLDRPAADRVPLKINRANDLKAGDKVGLIGYPSGLPVKIAFGESAVRSVDRPTFFTANLDAYGVNSGSPVINAKTGLVEGIVVRGDNDFVYANGCRISNVCPAAGCRGEDATKIGEIAAFIPGN